MRTLSRFALACALTPAAAHAVRLDLRAESSPAAGVTVRQYRTASPATNAWATFVDLCTARLSVVATQAGDSTQTTGAWAQDVGAVVATNGDFYRTGPLRVYGQAVGDGVAWPRAQTGTDPAYMGEWYWQDYGYIAFGPDWADFSHTGLVKRTDPAAVEGWAAGRVVDTAPPGTLSLVSGFPELVTEGRAVVCADPTTNTCFRDRSDMRDRNPRTAMGLTEDRGTFILLVVDGRTNSSAGMYGTELADTMAQLGAWQAFNLDGGGSSQLWVRGQGYLNDVDGNNNGSGTRAVANHWGIKVSRDNPARPSHCVSAEPCGIVPAAGGVVDDASACFQAFGPPAYWRTEARGEGGGQHWTNAFAGSAPENWAWWQLYLAEAGRYRVEVAVDPQRGVFERTRYEVLAGGETHSVVVDQSAGGWTSLGEFDFLAGGRQHVRVNDNAAAPVAAQQHIVADAVRLTRLDAPPPPPPPPTDPPTATPTDPPTAPTEPDAAPVENDAAPLEIDAARPESDAATPETDAAPVEIDAARPESDAATPESDAAPVETDAAPVETDANRAEAQKPTQITSGCAARPVPAGGPLGWAPLLVAAGLAALRRKRRHARALAAGATLTLAGCAPEPAADPQEEVESEPVFGVLEQAAYDCSERSDTGYRSGDAFEIVVVTVDGEPVERDTANAYIVMQAAAAQDGVEIRISSGFRTMAEQQYFYDCYTNCNCNDCNLAARPGYSNHQSGHALDLNTSSAGVLRWLNARGAEFGFERTVPSEDWHWEWWGGGPGGGPCAQVPCEALPPEGGVVDDGGPCFVPHGSDAYWRRVDGEGEGGGLRWTNAYVSDSPDNWARWRLDLAAAGTYRIEVTTGGAYGVWSQTRYEIKHADATEAVVIDQSAVNGWQSLGVFDFAAGGGQHVDVFDNYADVPPEQHIRVDAVRLTPVAPTPDVDAALPEPDAGVAKPDAAAPAPDAAEPESDAAEPAPDAAEPESDAAGPGAPPERAPRAVGVQYTGSAGCSAAPASRPSGALAALAALSTLAAALRRRARRR